LELFFPMNTASTILSRIDALGRISEDPHQLTRTFASPAMRQANDLVATWMRAAGMTVRCDAVGNLIGRYESESGNAKTLIIGSHLDTVRNAGKFDGPLGVVLGIACVEKLHQRNVRLPFAIEVVGFCDEEGVRYQSTYLGSRALAGSLTVQDLQRIDAKGISMAEAIRNFGGAPEKISETKADPSTLLGYLEAHIEQGPVLESKNLAVGVVTAIAGQTRLKLRFLGQAGHAGTTPMHLRNDALCAASEFILAVEKHGRTTGGLVATVGQIQNAPNASNVIPGEVILTVDIRHQNDSLRMSAGKALQLTADEIGARRGTKITWEVIQENAAVPCSSEMTELLTCAVKQKQREVIALPSGAGHDAAVMGQITPAAMLFIRCKGGISHHPDESVEAADVTVALDVLQDFLQLLAQKHG
jgi:allantoate deiminase